MFEAERTRDLLLSFLQHLPQFSKRAWKIKIQLKRREGKEEQEIIIEEAKDTKC
jgi:hypothetical protein